MVLIAFAETFGLQKSNPSSKLVRSRPQIQGLLFAFYLQKQKQIEDHFETLDYSSKYLKDSRLVLKLSLDLVVKEKLRPDNPAEKIEIVSDKKSLGIEIEHLEQDRQEVWLDIFKKDKRQWVYLFESILLTGARPEEACGFKWCAIDFEKDIVHINNAYKDTILYDENGQPFVSENLTNKMPQFIKKYNLEHLTTYGLRHSFATLCSTLGMPPEVLHVIMGHADFDTTRKYYIHITEERKRNEMLKLYRQQNSEPELQKLIEENDKYFNNVIKIRIQDIRPEKKLAS